jgi:Fe(II)/alpha-ketoglutarate-dependent arginine beta-hydroxylase
MTRIILSDDDIRSIHGLLNEIISQYRSAEESEFLCNVSTYAQELPRKLRCGVNRFRLAEDSAVLLVSGYPIDEERLGPTPACLRDAQTLSDEVEEEMLFTLVASLLGDVIGWSSQHCGRIIHDVFPVKAHAAQQIGTGSEQLIWWHTEDAFHDSRGDYVGLMCLRNPDGVATTVCPIDCVPLTEQQAQVLSQPLFIIRPDESHQRKNAADAGLADGQPDPRFARVEEMSRNPKKVPILSGDLKAPYIRIDPYFMQPAVESEARQAMEELTRSIDEKIQELVLAQGDICFIDNFRAVHGRKPFKARYDNKDRWLKRINITRDLRKSRGERSSALSRIIT